MHQNEDAISIKNFIKYSIINVLKDKRKKKFKDVIKVKFMFHVMRTKKVLMTIIFLFSSTLKNTII